MNYRPEIDGLRAIAVVSVVSYHLFATQVPGGFAGVDIFFVISGYLITSQIEGEAALGKFSLRQFYKRRINRILPPLLTMIAAVSVAAWAILSPADLVIFAKSAVYSAIGLSNLFLWKTCGNYFHANAAEVTLLHTWSLGVEEQFYAIWPLVVLFLIRLKRTSAVALLAALTIAAVGVSQAGIAIFQSASFYLLPTRFFELMIGGVLALSATRRATASHVFSEIGAVVGFVLVGVSLFLFNRNLAFPGVHALAPCLGTALLIWSGERSRIAHRLLTLPPLVFIGLISYSLYLWHWPIISFLHYLGVAIDPPTGSAVAGASILLAWLSWSFIEVPMRRSGAIMSFRRVLVRRFALPALALGGLVATVSATRGFPQRFDPRVAQMETMRSARPEILRSGCHVSSAFYRTPPSALCRLGVTKSAPDGILIGDSFANHFTGMIDTMASVQGLSFVDYTMDGCPPILGYDSDKGGLYTRACRLRNESAFREVVERHYKRVILAANWPRSGLVTKQLALSIHELEKSGAQVTLILANESIPDAASCPVRRLMYRWPRDCDSIRAGPPAYIDATRLQFTQLHIIDPNTAFCANNRCSPLLGDTLLYRDDDHLNDVGSRAIGRSLLQMGVVL